MSHLVRQILGEDGVADDGGLSAKALRKRLRCWVDAPTNSIAVFDLPKVLRELCMLDLDAEHSAELERVAKSSTAPPTSAHAAQTLVKVYEGGTAVIRAPVRPEWDNVCRDQLVHEIILRDKSIAEMKADNGKAVRRRRDLMQQVVVLQNAVESKDAEIQRLKSLLTLRSGVRNVSVVGGYRLALGRNRKGHTSCEAVVSILGSTPEQGCLKHKDCVIRFEHLATRVQRVLSNHYYQELKVNK